MEELKKRMHICGCKDNEEKAGEFIARFCRCGEHADPDDDLRRGPDLYSLFESALRVSKDRYRVYPVTEVGRKTRTIHRCVVYPPARQVNVTQNKRRKEKPRFSLKAREKRPGWRISFSGAQDIQSSFACSRYSVTSRSSPPALPPGGEGDHTEPPAPRGSRFSATASPWPSCPKERKCRGTPCPPAYPHQNAAGRR